MTSEQGDRGPGLRLATWNIHACVGSDGEFRPDRILDVLADIDADVVGLQEVENRRFAGHDVVGYLAHHLGMQAFQGPTLERRHGAYGNLLLSRLPPQAIRRHDLSCPGREPRGAIEASFEWQGQPFRVFTTHLGLSPSERGRQLDELMRSVPDRGAVLLGDLNEWHPFGRASRILKARFGRQPRLRSFPASRPALALDRILVLPPVVCEDIRVERSGPAALASDHLPVCARLRIDSSRHA